MGWEMKENRLFIIIFGIIATFSLFLLIWSEYWDYLYVTNYLPFFKEHRNFWENILLGVFASALLVEVSSIIGYICSRERLIRETRKDYFKLKNALHHFEIDNNKIEFKIQLHDIWLMNCIHNEEYNSFFNNCINKQIHDLIREIVLRHVELEEEEASTIYNTINKEFQQTIEHVNTYFHELDLKITKKFRNSGKTK